MKNILIIGPYFYQYTQLILDTLKDAGYNVTYYDARPKMGQFKKFFFNYVSFFHKKLINNYIKQIIKENDNVTFDLVLVLSVVTFTKEQMDYFLSNIKCNKKIYYMWDAITNYPVVSEYLPLFDKAYSFDPADCKKYNLIYQNTFYSKNAALDNKCEKQQFDIFFIASFLPKRYIDFKKFKQICENQNIKFKYFIVIKTYFTYLFFKIIHHKCHLDKKDFSFKQVSEIEKNNYISSSKAILDIPFDNQTGITMRVIEALVNNKKVITTNQYVGEYSFYNKNNFFIIGKDDYSNLKDFLSTDFVKVDFNYEKEFSVNSLINNIIINNL